MHSDYSRFEPFEKICRKICLNIPVGFRWQWDLQRDMALVTLELPDMDLVFLPMVREFHERWNFTTPRPEVVISNLIEERYGLFPGQTFFISLPVDDLYLFAAWWPWGKDEKVSMRVGLFSAENGKVTSIMALLYTEPLAPVTERWGPK